MEDFWYGMEMEWKKIASMEYGKIVFHSIPYHALLRDPHSANNLVFYWICAVNKSVAPQTAAAYGFRWEIKTPVFGARKNAGLRKNSRRGCDQNWCQFRLAVSTANGSWRFNNCQFCWQLALAVEHWQLAVVHWQLAVEHWQLTLGKYHQKGGDC